MSPTEECERCKKGCEFVEHGNVCGSDAVHSSNSDLIYSETGKIVCDVHAWVLGDGK